MTTRPEALRLADELDENWEYHSDRDSQAAAELRRLHEENASLRREVAAQSAQEEIQRLTALVRAQQITIEKLEAQHESK